MNVCNFTFHRNMNYHNLNKVLITYYVYRWKMEVSYYGSFFFIYIDTFLV